MALGVGWPLAASAQPEDDEEEDLSPATSAGEEPEPPKAPGDEGEPEKPPPPPETPEEPEEPLNETEPEGADESDTRATTNKPAAKPQTAAAGKDASPSGEPGGMAGHRGRFSFGSYGRVMAAGDGRGRPGRNADVVAHGSRLDHENYVELELRRDDHWAAVEADTRFVATLALGNPIFHYDGEFDARLAVRNLYIEEKHLGLKNLSLWAGSRMLRGDDIYLLDFWPLDNLNTMGAGLRYDAETHTSVGVHVGLGQPSNPFYSQQAERPAPLNQFGSATIDILDRQRWVGSLRAEQQIRFDDAGIKLVAYGEVHQLPSGERETSQAAILEELPSDGGFVIGGQIGGFTGERDTHVNLFVRYASGIAAYGEFTQPEGLAPDRTADGAHELLVAAGGNWEFGPVAVMLGGYLRSFRNASEDLDFGDVDEGIVIFRPQAFFTDWAGLAVEGSYQAMQRGVLAEVGQQTEQEGSTDPQPLIARVSRVGVIPFVTPAGRGSFSRPVFWVIYTASYRDDGARALYPADDVFTVRRWEHFIGIGAEWWFGSTSYGDAQ